VSTPVRTTDPVILAARARRLYPSLTPVVAGHVVWAFGHEGGMQPGSFVIDLISLIQKADGANRGRLALGFPGYVVAVGIHDDPDGVGIATLRAIAGGARR
jgi:hypothetical protein